jgi:hypothetical protein
MRNWIAALLVICIPAVVAWAEPQKQAAALKVERIKPRHGKTGVPLDVRVQVKFSRPVDAASLRPGTAQITTLDGADVPVAYSLSQKGRVLVMTPVHRLRASTDYRIVVRPGVLTKDGRTLREDRHANFLTALIPDPFQMLRPDQFVKLPSTMLAGRAAHGALLLPGGNVLVAGGFTSPGQFANDGDVFDATTNTFTATAGPMVDPRAYPPVVRFGGASMVIGGAGRNGPLASTEVFFEDTRTFVPGPGLKEPRDRVAAVVLKDGRILVTGGVGPLATVYSATAEIYDANAGGFRYTARAPLAARAGHTLTLMPDGSVLIVGGNSNTTLPPTAEIFDPITETFTPTASAPLNYRQGHTATLVEPSGLVLLVDGFPEIEAFDPKLGAFFPAGQSSSFVRKGSTASLLTDGRVLIAGGVEIRGGTEVMLDRFDLWVPANADHGVVVNTQVVFPEPRYGHTATTLSDDRILFVGGFGLGDAPCLDSAVVFTPDRVVK